MKLKNYLAVCSILAGLTACKDGIEIIDVEVVKETSFVYHNNLEDDVTFSFRSIGVPDKNFSKVIKSKDSLSLSYIAPAPTPFSAYLNDTVDIVFKDMSKVTYYSTDKVSCCTHGTGVFDFYQYDRFDKTKLETTKEYHYSIDSIDVSNAKSE
jgi:hypothetical protein